MTSHANGTGHQVLRDANTTVPVDFDMGSLVHTRAVVAGVPLDHDVHWNADSAGDRVGALGVSDAPRSLAIRIAKLVKLLIKGPEK